jgi:hypothetical protein
MARASAVLKTSREWKPLEGIEAAAVMSASRAE